MIQSTNPYLNFNGDAQQALELYQRVFRAELSALMRWSEMPGEAPAAIADRIMYARLELGGGAIELSDVAPTSEVEVGSGCFVAVHCTDPEQLDRWVAALADAGGSVEMPPADSFWDARYARVRDRFGVLWSFNCPHQPH